MTKNGEAILSWLSRFAILGIIMQWRRAKRRQPTTSTALAVFHQTAQETPTHSEQHADH